jgi:acetylglutamate/LysW-gamma-L-alpha-aminoadipate kinase
MLVIKIGGSLRDPEPLLRDISVSAEPVVIVHGASRDLNELSTRLGHPAQMVESVHGEVSRYTDAITMDHFLMAYAGRTNKRIVERLQQLGVNAVGLTGLDGAIVRGRRRADIRVRDNGRVKVLHDNHVGSIDHVDTTLLALLLARGYTPVLAPPIAAEDGTAINVDGDRLAAAVAVALGAQRLLIFADTPGLLRDAGDERSLIACARESELDSLLEVAGGRARSKLRAAADARRRGVGAVGLVDGRIDRPVAHALEGAGTWFD